jgi:hypothetical protein
MSKVTKALKADLPALAELLRSKGKGKDTILAHINPKEAELLKRRGGSGDINPDTGLPMFQTEDDFNVPPPAESYGPSIQDASPDVQQSYTGAQTGGVPTAIIEDESNRGTVTYDRSPTQNVMYSPGLKPYSISPDTLQASAGIVPSAKDLTPSISDRVGTALGNVTTEQLVKALGLGGLGVLGARNANVAGGQNQQATEELRTIARPYQAKGQEMIGAAERGELTPQSQQAFQAAMAQANQSLANRGGVGQQQVQAQMAALYDKLLQNQYSYGLQVANIGDNIAMGAIKQGLTLDQNLQRTTQNFYAQLAAIASGSVIGGTRGEKTNG